eukprot:TRINITY_DN9925_c0_g1_i3.p1 TRINITY_DN9925_c0_g1~~TRINITY_DN9925_c0_g1_i3.p1  ORF type:complete len:448 (+),score=97.73 TRINITY_DN9925_c0_g1_i3:78-1421(+)
MLGAVNPQKVPQLRCGYVGETKDGRQHGRGTQVYANGDVYQGSWFEGKIHGRGVYTYANGCQYDGEFKMAIRHGNGTYKLLNGDVYTGDWVDGQRTGKGKMLYGGDTGEEYQGSFRGNKRDGYGRYRYATGGVYEGYWVLDKKQGKGRFDFPSSDIYIGQWSDDLIHGQGTLTWSTPTGSVKYAGLFQNGRIAGTFCPASPKDNTGNILAQPCEYSSGQCRVCGGFNTPCPVMKPGETPKPCVLEDGRCKKCGKTDKVNQAQPLNRSQQKNSGKALVSEPVLTPLSEFLRGTDIVPLNESQEKRLVEDDELPAMPAKVDATDNKGETPAMRRAVFLDNDNNPVAPPQEEASVVETPPATEENVSGIITKAKELLEGCRGGLGMAIADFADPYGTVVVKVVTVKASSPAGKAGVRRNDVILKFCGKPIVSKAIFLNIARDLTPGEGKV